MRPTRRAAMLTAAALPALPLAAAGAGLPAATTLPPAWAAIERSALYLVPEHGVEAVEVRAAILSAIVAGMDPDDLSAIQAGTKTRPRGPVLYFGDWRSGPYFAAQASGVMRFRIDDTPEGPWRTNERLEAPTTS